jgi:transcriptional regulator with XRE-family HTH domain
MPNFKPGNHRAGKLTGEKVLEIRRRYREERGCTQGMLARDFGVTIGTIGNIVNGLTWQFLTQGEAVERPPILGAGLPPTDYEIEASIKRLATKVGEPSSESSGLERLNQEFIQTLESKPAVGRELRDFLTTKETKDES